MAIHRKTLQCLTCGQKTVTRTTLGNGDYQDCVFSCPKCGIEIGCRIQLYLNTRLRELTAAGLSAPNGSKPDMLKQLKIADLFVPFIDNKLRNGIGHNSAHYDVATDSIR
jgi:hypothetical protein